MAAEFWLSDGQWAAIEPFLPKNQPGPALDGDRGVISGIVYGPQGWMSVARLPSSLRTADHDLQSISAVGEERHLASLV